MSGIKSSRPKEKTAATTCVLLDSITLKVKRRKFFKNRGKSTELIWLSIESDFSIPFKNSFIGFISAPT